MAMMQGPQGAPERAENLDPQVRALLKELDRQGLPSFEEMSVP